MNFKYPNFDLIEFNFKRDLISLYEFPLLLFYVVIFLLIGFWIRNTFYSQSAGKKFFIPALILNIFGGVFICLIYNYYYVGGDTSAYFNDARLLIKLLLHDPSTALDVFFSSSSGLRQNHEFVFYQFRFLRADDTFMLVRIASIVQLFTFNSFLVTSAFFGFLSFFFSWAFYNRMSLRFPTVNNQLALAIFFSPSVIVWGSGLFKDTVCLALIFFILLQIEKWLAKDRSLLMTIVSGLIPLYLLISLKIYIVFALGLSIVFFFILASLAVIKNPALKLLIAPIILIIGLALSYLGMQNLGGMSKSEIYSMEKILQTAETTGEYLQYLSNRDDGSGYDLGKIEYTPFGLLRKAPQAINATLFRPYLWEVKNPLMLLSALESFAILLLTIYVIVTVGFSRIVQVLTAYPIISSMIVYSLFFSFSIGITTFNFGSLVRYKIPIIPFYLIALILLNYFGKIKRTSST